MGHIVTETEKARETSTGQKVHDAICCELLKVSEKINSILPAIESARPGSSSGIQILCALNHMVDKAKLLANYCAESSKLYLVVTAESIVLRCEKIRSQLNAGLSQIQTMVPLALASQISDVLNYLRDVKFIIGPKEEEARKSLLNLLSQTDLSHDQELEAFQSVASLLNISSPIALLIERRSIKKLLDKFGEIDDKKERILKYFLYLIKIYGKHMTSDSKEFNVGMNSESDACEIETSYQKSFQNIESETHLNNDQLPPEEFFCPLSSRLMHDPVIITSGKTYERFWIEKWFKDGNDTCPKTHKTLENLFVIPNSCMKDLISSWCKKHGVNTQDPCTKPEGTGFCSWQPTNCDSISSLKNVCTTLLEGRKGDCILENEQSNVSIISSSSSCLDLSPPKDMGQFFLWSDDYQRYKSFSRFSQEMYLRFLFGLSGLPSPLQEKAVEDIKYLLEGDNEAAFRAMLSNRFAEALKLFLKKACNLSDSQAQRSGAQIFLALISHKRWELTSFSADDFQLLSSLLNSAAGKEALMILEKLACHPYCVPYILSSGILLELVKFLDSEDTEYAEIVLEILSKLSSHGEIRSHFLSSGCINKLAQIQSNRRLIRPRLTILQNLVDDEEASTMIVDANGLISSVAEALESGNVEEKELAVYILHSLSSRNLQNCLLVLKEGVIPSLVEISVNGNLMAKENSIKLLQVLRDTRDNDFIDTAQPHSEPKSDLAENPAERSRKLRPKFGFLSRKTK